VVAIPGRSAHLRDEQRNWRPGFGGLITGRETERHCHELVARGEIKQLRCFGVSTRVAAVGSPPVAETRKIGAAGLSPKMIVPRLFHDPPRGNETPEVSICSGPPSMSARFS
jgi:hypothetical protein